MGGTAILMFTDSPALTVKGFGGAVMANVVPTARPIPLEVEGAARGPWFLGERFSALDIYIGVMTRWRPKRGWFETETPRLFAIARRADGRPELADVWKRNFPA